MKIVFFGTPDYVVPLLEHLSKSFKGKKGEDGIVAVVTQPPKPVGREQLTEYSPVDTWAHKRKVPIYFDPQDLVRDKIEADLGVVAAFGQIISKEVLEYFPNGLLNLHFSTLPDLRGASPVHAALILGREKIGVTIFKLDEALDHGKIVTQFTEPILATDTTESLRERLFARSADVLEDLLPAYILGKVNLKEQDHTKATFAKVIKKEDGFLPGKIIEQALKGEIPTLPREVRFMSEFKLIPDANFVLRLLKAFTPWPGVYTTVATNKEEEPKRLKILEAHIEEQKLILDKVQLEGKNPVTWAQFIQGYPNFEL